LPVFSVLSDPHQRAIYDCLGKDGLQEKGWQVAKRTKTPAEIREEYERLAGERAERRLQQRTNPTSRFTVAVNATELFERYGFDEELDPVLDAADSLPSIEVTEISFGQTVDCPLTDADNVCLGGNVSTRNGVGGGNVSASWRRVRSDSLWHELELGVGQGPKLGGKVYKRLTAKTFLNMSGKSSSMVLGSYWLMGQVY